MDPLGYIKDPLRDPNFGNHPFGFGARGFGNIDGWLSILGSLFGSLILYGT